MFFQANRELDKISAWFKTSKLLLHERKAKYIMFHKKRQRDFLSLNFKSIYVWRQYRKSSLHEIPRHNIDINISLNSHIQLIENKISKNVEVLHRTKHILSKDGLKNKFLLKLWK